MAKADAPMSSLQQARVVGLCSVYICVSGLLIRYNKFLIHKDRFPHSMMLSTLHMCMSLFLCSCLYLALPHLFSGMASTSGRRVELLRWFAPIGLTFAISLFCSNQAYLYSNVTFLQFMKEGNTILTFLISCAAGLQVLTRVKLAAIVWILTGSMMCVTHEFNFVWLGFIFQITSQLGECSRVVLGEIVLGGSGFKLDPLTYTLFAAPCCLVALVVGVVATWDPAIITDAAEWWPYLLPNMCLAFVLNVLVATIIKECSAVGFILAGVTKDIVLVIVSAIAFREQVSEVQALSFTMVLGGILFWSLMKAAPNHPVVRQVEDFMGMPRPDAEKNTTA